MTCLLTVMQVEAYGAVTPGLPPGTEIKVAVPADVAEGAWEGQTVASRLRERPEARMVLAYHMERAPVVWLLSEVKSFHLTKK